MKTCVFKRLTPVWDWRIHAYVKSDKRIVTEQGKTFASLDSYNRYFSKAERQLRGEK